MRIEPTATCLLYGAGDDTPWVITLPPSPTLHRLHDPDDLGMAKLPAITWDDDEPGSGREYSLWVRPEAVTAVVETGPKMRARIFEAFDRMEG